MTGRYSRSDRDHAVARVRELMASEACSVDAACEAVSPEIGVSTSALRRWVEQPAPAGNWLAGGENGPAESWEALADRILSGETPESIASGTGGAPSSVYSFLRRKGVHLGEYLVSVVNALLDEAATTEGGHDPDLWSATSRSRAARVPLTLRSNVTVAQAVGMEAAYRAGASFAQLARQWSISSDGVVRILTLLGVDTRARRHTRNEQILELRASGMSMRKIAEKVGTSDQTVWRVIQRDHGRSHEP